jgi:O-antigen ligase
LAFLLLLVYTAILMVRPQEWVEAMYAWPILKVVIFATCLAWLPTLTSGRWKFSAAPQNWLMLSFFAATLMSHASHFYFWAFKDAFEDVGKTVLVYFLVVSLTNSLTRMKVLVWVIIIGCLTMSAHGILQMTTGVGFGGLAPMQDHDLTRVRAFGIFSDPNDLALMLVMMLPFLFTIVITKGGSIAKRLACLGLTVPMFYCIYLANSRGGWLALAVTTVVFIFVNLGRKAGIVLAAMALGGLIALGPSRTGGMQSDRGRLGAWADGNSMLKSSPIFGVGIHRFEDFSERSIAAHNSLVQCYAELGLFGYFFWLALIVATLKDARAMARLAPGKAESPGPSERTFARAPWKNAARERSHAGFSTFSPAASPRSTVQGSPAAEAVTPERHFPRNPEYARLGKSILCAMAGFLVAGFFLSRAYIQPLYILIAMTAALRTTYCAESEPLESFFRKRDLKYVLLVEFLSIPVIYVLVRTLF